MDKREEGAFFLSSAWFDACDSELKIMQDCIGDHCSVATGQCKGVGSGRLLKKSCNSSAKHRTDKSITKRGTVDTHRNSPRAFSHILHNFSRKVFSVYSTFHVEKSLAEHLRGDPAANAGTDSSGVVGPKLWDGPTISALSEQQYLVWDIASRSTKWQDTSEIRRAWPLCPTRLRQWPIATHRFSTGWCRFVRAPCTAGSLRRASWRSSWPDGRWCRSRTVWCCRRGRSRYWKVSRRDEWFGAFPARISEKSSRVEGGWGSIWIHCYQGRTNHAGTAWI